MDSVLAESGDAQVIVVDNNSSDGTAELLRSYLPGITLLENGRNPGFAPAANQGLRLASGRHLLLLNPDTELTAGALAAMVGYLDSHPGVWALGPQLLNADGSVQPSCRQFPDHEIMLYEFTGLSHLLPRSRRFGRWRMGNFDHLAEAEVQQPMGACLMVKREVVETVGLMDEQNFPMFCNEVDWCRRIIEKGGRIVYLPRARVYHRHGASTGQARTAMIISSHRSMARYFDKHYPGRISTWLVKFFLLFGLPFRISWNLLVSAAKRKPA
jgi:hypothetical protein